MKITEKIVSKIEGEATLKIKGGDVVEKVEIEFWQYHGVEGYLKGRDVTDALVINPRICGICGHSHLYATVRAIEEAIGAKISNKARILREVTSLLEIVENHIKWFYITLFPTVEKNREFVFKAVRFSSKISKAIALLAGQFPHNSYMIPGGVTCDPTHMEIVRLKDLIKEIAGEYADEIMDFELYSEDLNSFFNHLPKEIGKGLNRFLVLGKNAFFKPNGDLGMVREEKNSSLSKNALYGGEFYEVGPLARMLGINDEKITRLYKKHADSIYTRIVARMYEPLVIFEYLSEIIEKLDLCEPSYIKNEIRNGNSEVCIEAPRGSLIHKISINDGKIENYTVIVPTQFNLASSKVKNSPAQAALIGEKKEYVDIIFRCFDICAVCMSH